MGENQNTELQENSLENTENDVNQTEIEFVDREITVSANQLQKLIDQNKQLKSDLGALVSVFQMFLPMFSGKTSALSLIPTITKMINNKEVGENIQTIIPIIEKYNGQNQ